MRINVSIAVDIADITNSAAWTQTNHTETYTVGADGKSLFYRGKDTGMKLKTVAKAGDKISVTDTSIPVKPRAPKPTPTGGGSGGGTGGTSGGSGSGAGGASGGGIDHTEHIVANIGVTFALVKCRVTTCEFSGDRIG